MSGGPDGARWPEAPVAGWLTTAATIHMWTQVVGKVKLARAPAVNHWWHVAFTVTPRGLTTGTIPHGGRAFQVDFDFHAHRLFIATSDGGRADLPLASKPLPEFHADFFACLAGLGIDVRIWPVSVELPRAVNFTEDCDHSTYDPAVATRLAEILVLADQALARFRGRFIGKCSAVNFYWGSFDLAVTRFSGRGAPPHPGGVPNLADRVTREAYSHEVSSCGFWPGTAGGFERPAFYAYAYPEPPDFAAAEVAEPAFYSSTMREFVLPYDDLRRLADPPAELAGFLATTYAAAADAAGWDRQGLERPQ